MGEIRKIVEEVKFKASDGMEFDDEESAEEYEGFITTRQEYIWARNRFKSKYGDLFRTQDGYKFSLTGNIWEEYWVIEYQGDYPYIRKIEPRSYHADFTLIDRGEGMAPRIAFLEEVRDHSNRNLGNIWKAYDPTKLFKRKHNAEKELVLRLQKYANELLSAAQKITERLRMQGHLSREVVSD